MTSQGKKGVFRTNRFAKDYKKLPHSTKIEVWRVVQKLSEDIFDQNLDVKKLVGYKNLWRARVSRDWRMIFVFDETSITLLRVAHRKDIYRLQFND